MEGAAQNIPYPDNKFEVVTMGSVLHKIHEERKGQMKALNKVYRVLKPGGTFLTLKL